MPQLSGSVFAPPKMNRTCLCCFADEVDERGELCGVHFDEAGGAGTRAGGRGCLRCGRSGGGAGVREDDVDDRQTEREFVLARGVEQRFEFVRERLDGQETAVFPGLDDGEFETETTEQFLQLGG